MNRIISLLALIFTLFALQACGDEGGKNNDGNDPIDVVTPNKERPKSPIILQKTEFKITPADPGGFVINTEDFDEKGRITQLTSYDYFGSGEVESTTQYSYNDLGQLIKSTDGKTTDLMEYDDEGRLSKKSWSRNGDGASETYTYNDKDDWIEIKYFDGNGKYDFSRVREYTYNALDSITEEKQWEKYTDGSADLLQYWQKYEYNKKGLLTASESLREDGQVTDRRENEYDGAGNLIVSTDLEGGVKDYALKNTYNEYGEVTFDETFSCNETGCDLSQYTNEYRYDSYGNKEYHMYKHSDGDAWGSRFEYKFAE